MQLYILRLFQTASPVQPPETLRALDQVQRSCPQPAAVRLSIVQSLVGWDAKVDDLSDCFRWR